MDKLKGDRVKALTGEQLKREAERLIREGKMPTLDQLCRAVLEVRKEYAARIRRARREAEAKPN